MGNLKVLALEPYYGGSHQAFLLGWRKNSRHEWTIIGLPAHHWKWRMRHSSVTLSRLVDERVRRGEAWDVVMVSDMLNLAEFRGLVTADVSQLPAVAYFHENQLTYPVRQVDERDLHFAYTNFITGLAAEQVWFNSDYHRKTFLRALMEFTSRMPDYAESDYHHAIEDKSICMPQGIEPIEVPSGRIENIPTILWAARWDHDKNPEKFFAAVTSLINSGLNVRINVIGQSFKDIPPIFDEMHDRLRQYIHRWGYQDSRTEYERALAESDIIVSTADHEFFGVAIVEAVDAGVFPLMPNDLAYPELFMLDEHPGDYFYDGTLEHLVTRLGELVNRVRNGQLWPNGQNALQKNNEQYYWSNLAPRLDRALNDLVSNCTNRAGRASR